MSSILTILRHTIQEALKRRLIHTGVLVSLLFLLLYGIAFACLYGKATEQAALRPANQIGLVVSSTLLSVLGLFAVHLMSGLLALFLTVGAISGEIESGAMHAVLAHPIRRWQYLLGRWLGYVLLLCTYVTLMAGALLTIAGTIAGYEPLNAVAAVSTICLGAVSMLSLSLLGSARLSTLANGIVCFTAFGAAWLSGIIEYVGNLMANEALVNLGIIVSLIVPHDGIWRAASFFAQSAAFLTAASFQVQLPFVASAPPAWAFLAWTVAHAVACLAWAIHTFESRDL
ncbi:MAG: ABC transporter permease subunit [Chloroflexota bacterium]